MTAQKPVDRPQGPGTPSQSPARKLWVKKSPVDVVLEQCERQRKKVSDLKTSLTIEERELQKLEEATKILRSS